jgi:hypothetical protein
MVDVVEYLRLLKREQIGVVLSEILDVSLFVSLRSSSIEGMGISGRGSWVNEAIAAVSAVGLTYSSSESSESSESLLRVLSSIWIPGSGV